MKLVESDFVKFISALMKLYPYKDDGFNLSLTNFCKLEKIFQIAPLDDLREISYHIDETYFYQVEYLYFTIYGDLLKRVQNYLSSIEKEPLTEKELINIKLKIKELLK